MTILTFVYERLGRLAILDDAMFHQIMQNSPKTIDILLFNRFSGICLANTIEPLRAANDLAKKRLYSWRFLTISGEPARSSSSMQVASDGKLSDHRGDMLIVMPSYGYRDYTNTSTSQALRSAAKRYERMAGFDTGAWMLAHAGLLDGYDATIHWDELAEFTETFPDVNGQRLRYVADRDRLTCAGALAALETILDQIGHHHGAGLRLEVAMLFMAPGATQTVAPPIARSKRVGRALSAMRANIEQPLPIPEIAEIAGCTQGELCQKMHAELGATPQGIYKRLRLSLVNRLALETNLSISEIAFRAGYDNPAAMTRAFKTEFGTTPQRLRLEHS